MGNFWNGPAFLAGQSIPTVRTRATPFLGQGAPQPSDFRAELDSYHDQAAQLPPEVAAPILETLQTCEIFMAPENFVSIRTRGCLNSVLAQLRAAGAQV
jgi:hypothetical protein